MMISLLMMASALVGFSKPERAVITCVVPATVELGQHNTELTDTVIMAAYGRCSNEWARVEADQNRGAIGAASAGGAFQQMFLQNRQIEMNRFRARVYTMAFEALIQARGQ